jgi:S1-C subfamily serine protease
MEENRMCKSKIGPALVLAALSCTAIAQEQRAVVDDRARTEQLEVSVEQEMREAEARLEEAARRIAELSARQLPTNSVQSWAFAFSGRPMLGITIDGDATSGPAKGAVIRGVTPGGAAFDAGLRAGDTIVAINKQPMNAATSAEANAKLLAFMEGVEAGDTLDIEYLRNGKLATVQVKPVTGEEHSFAFGGAAPPLAPGVPVAPWPQMAPGAPAVREVFRWHGVMGWRDMELTPLSADLGKYFGTDKGLLVVRAPTGGELQLKDGDVIQTIGGREPASVSHAMRILASYQPGEKIKLEIMRDKRRKTLEVELPDDRQSSATDGSAPVIVDFRHARKVH